MARLTRSKTHSFETAPHVKLGFDEPSFTILGSHYVEFDFILDRHPNTINSDAPTSTMLVNFGKLVGIGSLWDIYQAKLYPDTLTQSNDGCINVIVKFTSCNNFDGDKYFGEDVDHILDRESSYQAVINDHEYFTQQLNHLQSKDIPKHYGTFINSELRICCMILEDVGKPIGKGGSMNFIPKNDKERVLEIYQAFHSKGIWQGAVDASSIYQRDDTREIKVVDFHRSFFVKDEFYLGWEQHIVKMECALFPTINLDEFRQYPVPATLRLTQSALDKRNAVQKPGKSII